MKLAATLSRHKISHVFKIWPEWTIYLGLLKRPYLTFWGCWTQVSDRCPLGDVFHLLSDFQNFAAYFTTHLVLEIVKKVTKSRKIRFQR